MERITTFFTENGVPKTGLSPTINIIEVNGTVRVTNWPLTEVGLWFYVYDFNYYDPDKIYCYQIDGTATLSGWERYKFGDNSLDNYTNKYSFGRTWFMIPTYDKQFKDINKQFKSIKIPEYNEKETQEMIKKLLAEIQGKNNNDVIDELSQIKDSMQKVAELIASIDAREWVNQVGTSLSETKENILEELRTIAQSLSDTIESKHWEMSANLEEKLDAKRIADPFIASHNTLEGKIEELFTAMVQKHVPERILNQFKVQLIKKDDSAALDELTSMSDD